jgi:hypothetical protein
MPPEDQAIGTWSGASREEILLIFGALAVAVTLAFAVRALRRWLIRRREMHSFFRIVDVRNLDEQEEEEVRALAAEGHLRKPTEILTSLSTYDALAEGSLRKSVKKDDREIVRRRMDCLYRARKKLFPEAQSWQRGTIPAEGAESSARSEKGDSQPAGNVQE